MVGHMVTLKSSELRRYDLVRFLRRKLSEQQKHNIYLFSKHKAWELFFILLRHLKNRVYIVGSCCILDFTML